MEKTCKACGLAKPFEFFHKDRSKKDGLNHYCKTCHIARQKEYDLRPARRASPEGMKYCGRCKETKPTDQFHKSSKTYDGLDKRCKHCTYLDRKAWAEKNPEKANALQKKWREANPERAKDFKRRVMYGLEMGQYGKMLEAQGGRCALCRTDKAGGKGGTFHIDHCHDSGNVRGLLCHNCNVGIGHFFHNEDLLLKAINYLAESRSVR